MVNIMYSLIDIFSIFILSFILIQNCIYYEKDFRQKTFSLFLISIIFFCIVDCLWGATASGFIFNPVGLMLATSLYYFLSAFCAYSWIIFFIYYTGLCKKLKHRILLISLLFIPNVILIVILAVNWKSGILFSINKDNLYQRGNISMVYLIYLIYCGYYIICFLLMVWINLSIKVKFKKAMYLFSIFPMINSILQMFFPEIPFYAIGFTFSAFVVFLFDIVEEHDRKSLRQLEGRQKDILDKCNDIITKGNRSKRSTDLLLEVLGKYFKADRAYVFEINGNRKLISNTYEWNACGIPSHKQSFQNVIVESDADWLSAFEKHDKFTIKDLEKDIHKGSELYKALKKEEIYSLIAVPLMNCGEIEGFVGLDNPRVAIDDLTIIHTVSLFIYSEILHRKILEKEFEKNSKVISAQKITIENQEEKLKEAVLTAKKATDASLIDKLSGLYNKAAGLAEMNKYYSLKAKDEAYALIFSDIDLFKNINDTYGHLAGDQVIEHVSRIIRKIFADDICMRFGGDEFLILVKNLPAEEQLKKKLEKFRDDLRKPFGENFIEVTTSLGVCITSYKNIDEAMETADKALYAVKNSTRDAFNIIHK